MAAKAGELNVNVQQECATEKFLTPSLRLSVRLQQVEMPSDVHPLPDDISAYVSYNAAHFNIHLTPAASGPTSYQFVYPFTLEPHVLASDPPVYERVRSQRRELAQLLEQRKQDEANRRWASQPLAS